MAIYRHGRALLPFWNQIRVCSFLAFNEYMHKARLMFSDKETRFLEAGLLAAVPLSILIAVAMVSLTFDWFG